MFDDEEVFFSYSRMSGVLNNLMAQTIKSSMYRRVSVYIRHGITGR